MLEAFSGQHAGQLSCQYTCTPEAFTPSPECVCFATNCLKGIIGAAGANVGLRTQCRWAGAASHERP